MGNPQVGGDLVERPEIVPHFTTTSYTPALLGQGVTVNAEPNATNCVSSCVGMAVGMDIVRSRPQKR